MRSLRGGWLCTGLRDEARDAMETVSARGTTKYTRQRIARRVERRGVVRRASSDYAKRAGLDNMVLDLTVTVNVGTTVRGCVGLRDEVRDARVVSVRRNGNSWELISSDL